ncbi:MAG: alginate lyase family protein [Acidobacteriaceae bacterium]|nr:alginate lyase family protein [Acidobacteriaceae bacterium]
MRSRAELTFRLRQELMNVLLAIRPPKLAALPHSTLALSDAQTTVDAVRGTDYARSVVEIANEILQHNSPLLGLTLETGPEIRWRRDYSHNIETEPVYFRRIPYLDFARVGDHKLIWELNRHQHLVLLAQAYLFTRDPQYRDEIFSQLDSWLEQNPFQRGMNWASALEVAFRTLSWIWVYHFIGAEMPDAFRHRFLTALYQHGAHLSENLSIYFSPNTHLLGEAVALHALGALFRHFPHARTWRERGRSIVEAQLHFQVQEDGSHFEQSSYYHVYALDLFLFSYLLADRPQHWNSVLMKMAEYLHWLLGPNGRITFRGDDDGGRTFHPYGDRAQFGRATLATCGILFNRQEWIGTQEDIAQQAAWWLGAEALHVAMASRSAPTGSRLFEQSGLTFLQSGDLFLQMDCGGFGYGGAGHSHSDSLSITLQLAGEFVFIDPGTFTYVADPAERAWFRGSRAHNTVRIDRLDQGTPAGPFRWSTKPDVKLLEWQPQQGKIVASCRYAEFLHRRTIQLDSRRLEITDEIEGPPGPHLLEQIWQLGTAAHRVRLTFSVDPVWQRSQFSPAYGQKLPGESLIISLTSALPARLAMRLTLMEEPA